MLLSTNDKTIKLWKVHEKKVTIICSSLGSNDKEFQVKAVSEMNLNAQARANPGAAVPKLHSLKVVYFLRIEHSSIC